MSLRIPNNPMQLAASERRESSIPNNKIFIPVKGVPKIITSEIKEFASVIGCESKMGKSISYLEYFGYELSIFMDDSFALKNLPVNKLATLIFKEDVEICGNCILIDDNKELTMDDFSKMVKIALALPSSDWIPEPVVEEFINNRPKLSAGRDEFDKMMIRTYDKYIRKNPKELRLKVWNKVKEFYVPPSDESESSSD